MLPLNLQVDHFAKYPPEARKRAVANLAVLRTLPLAFLPSLLRELIEYDYKFPEEQLELDQQFVALNAISPAQLQHSFQQFGQISLNAKLEEVDWVNSPAVFVQQESAFLWCTHQLDAFRKAAADYVEQLHSSASTQPLPVNRLGIVLLGHGVDDWKEPLFRNLRQHGTYFSKIRSANGRELLVSAVEARAKAHPLPYAHWSIDGEKQDPSPSLLTQVSYANLEPVRTALLKHIDTRIEVPGMGPEELLADMAHLVPADLGLAGTGDSVLDHFQVKVLTEGSGTQLFSTTFVQWATREALRRAQPLTMMARFTPRQRQRPMNELLSARSGASMPDPAGSIVDADMAAYYHWINQQRLPGSERSAFLVWYEGHNQALVISSKFPRGTESQSPLGLDELVALATS